MDAAIIGVYLPCADLGMDYIRESEIATLAELEKVISDSTNLGPVVIAGDFNLHTSATYGAHVALPLLTLKEFC